MKHQSYILLLAVPLLLKTVAVKASESKVVKLDTNSFSSSLDEKNNFVMFYAPWCGHCQNLKPVWDELADSFQAESEKNVVIAKVDCTTDAELCSKNEVTGYPTLKLFIKGSSEPQRYRGPRDLASLTAFISENLGLDKEEVKKPANDTEPAKPVEGAIELTEGTFKDHVATGEHFIKFYAPWCGHCQRLAPTWDDLAQSIGHDTSITIGKVDCTQHRTLCNDFDVKGYPTLLWIKDGKKVEKYQGSRTHEDLKGFVEKMSGKRQPTVSSSEEKEDDAAAAPSPVVQLVESNFENGIASGVTFVKFYAPWCGHCKRLAPTWDALGAKFVGTPDVKIAKVDCTDGSNRQLCTQQKVNGFPTVFLYIDGKKIEEYDGDRSLDDLFTFVSKNMQNQQKDEL